MQGRPVDSVYFDMSTANLLIPPGSLVDEVEPDLSLLQRYIQTSDADAFAIIVQRYGQLVYAASLRVLGDQARAQDVSQETFFRLMRQPRLVTQSLAGWLHRSATHLALDVRRSEKARNHREHVYGEQHAEAVNEDATWAELSPIVDQVMDELPESTRSILVRHYLQGTPQAELAVELRLSPATISRRIKAAIGELNGKLQEKGVQLGIGALVLFFAQWKTRSASAALMTEMGKMQLIASVRTVANPMPVQPTPVGQSQLKQSWHHPLKPRGQLQVSNAAATTSVASTVTIVSIIVVIVAYAIAVGISFYNAPPIITTPPPAPPSQALNDR